MHKAGTLLLSHGKADIWTHSQAVARHAQALAVRFGLDSDACVEAALCHDIGRIIAAKDMLAGAKAACMALDPSELQHPFLLHQRFSAILCVGLLHVSDPLILSAVGCHTTLKRNASAIDMAVYLADKIAWDQPGEPPYLAAVTSALETSLHHACHAHMCFAINNNMILTPHQWFLDAYAQLEHSTLI